MPAAAPIPTQSEPPTLADERDRVRRTLAGLDHAANLPYIASRTRLPAGSVRRALRRLIAEHHIVEFVEKGERRYRLTR